MDLTTSKKHRHKITPEIPQEQWNTSRDILRGTTER